MSSKKFREETITAKELMQMLGIKGKLLCFSTPQKNQPKDILERILLIKVEEIKEEDGTKRPNTRRKSA